MAPASLVMELLPRIPPAYDFWEALAWELPLVPTAPLTTAPAWTPESPLPPLPTAPKGR